MTQSVHINLRAIGEVNEQVGGLLDAASNVKTNSSDAVNGAALDKFSIKRELVVSFSCFYKVLLKVHLSRKMVQSLQCLLQAHFARIIMES